MSEPETAVCELDAIETPRVLEQRFVAIARDILDNRRHHGIDIGCGIALSLNEPAERGLETGIAGREGEWP